MNTFWELAIGRLGEFSITWHMGMFGVVTLICALPARLEWLQEEQYDMGKAGNALWHSLQLYWNITEYYYDDSFRLFNQGVPTSACICASAHFWGNVGTVVRGMAFP